MERGPGRQPKLRIAVGGVIHESNAFAPTLTTVSDFERELLLDARKWPAEPPAAEEVLAGFIRASGSLAFSPVPALYARAGPGGPLSDSCFTELTERLKAAIHAVEPVDGVLLVLHGAMSAEREDDAEGVLLAEVRSCLPPGVPVFATFDLRANLSPLMVATCDLLIGGAAYGTDRAALGHECGVLLERMIRDELRPVMALAKPPLMPPRLGERAADAALGELLATARSLEAAPGMLRACTAVGFPFADAPRMGPGFLAISDGDPDLAADVSQLLAEAAWNDRKRLSAAAPAQGGGTPTLGEPAEPLLYRNVRRPLYPLDVW